MNLHFITNVQLKNIIGKDLINNDNIAILELVKNAFDANAKRTDISFVNLKNNDDLSIEKYSSRTSRLIIRDNGVGMDINDIKNKWLNIAYSEKKKKSYQHNRMMAAKPSKSTSGHAFSVFSSDSDEFCGVLVIDGVETYISRSS